MNVLQFTDEFKGKMAPIKTRYSAKDTKVSQFAPQNPRSGFSTDVKLWDIVRGMHGEGKKQVFIGIVAGGKSYCEISEPGKNTQACLLSIDGTSIKVKATEINENGVYFPYENTHKGSVICGALIGLLGTTQIELTSAILDLQPYIGFDENADDWTDPLVQDDFGKAINLFSNSLYYSLKAYALGEPNVLRAAEIKNLKTSVTPIYGTPVVLEVANVKKNDELKIETGKYSFCKERIFSASEQEMVPVMADSYVMPKWCNTICEEIQQSQVFPDPFRNILLTGPAGTGKTKGAMAMAQSLGLPYVKLTCSPDTDMFDLVGQMQPNTSKELPEDLPTFDDVANDFKGTFKKLFGREATNFDCEADCYSEIFNRAMTQKESDFTYVESDFIKAIKYGWLVEIQEPTVIKRNAVLVGLNGIMENDKDSCITLPTGEIIRRHPHAVVVLTTNADYDGCNKIQQSVLSRAEIVREIPNPEKEVMVERTMKATGFKDKKTMEKMVSSIMEVATYAVDKDIRDGICGPRELMNWAKTAILGQARKDGNNPFESVIIDADVLMEAAFSTVFEKLSQVPDDKEDIITAVFAKNFGQDVIEFARNSYIEGLC